MGDRVARALAAGDEMKVGDVTYKLRPIPVRHLKELEAKALREYKRNVIRTFSDSADILGDQAQQIIEAKVTEVSLWTLCDLPQMEAFDCSRVKINDKIKAWLKENFSDAFDVSNEDKQSEEDRLRLLLNNALDSKRIRSEQVKGWTKTSPRRAFIRYDQWWVTATMTGMVLFILSSIQVENPNVTEKEIDNWPISKLVEASRIVESLTSSEMGNG